MVLALKPPHDIAASGCAPSANLTIALFIWHWPRIFWELINAWLDSCSHWTPSFNSSCAAEPWVSSSPTGHSMFWVCNVPLWVGQLLALEGFHAWLWWPWWVPWWVTLGNVQTAHSFLPALSAHKPWCGTLFFTDLYLMAPQWNLLPSH